MKTILFSPISNGTNQYVKSMQSILEYEGFRVVGMREAFSTCENFFDVEIAFLNWFESSASFFDYLKKLLEFYFLKAFRKKVIFVCHNRQAHNNNSKYPKKLMKLLSEKSDLIVGLSAQTKVVLKAFINSETIEEKFRLIPHISYEGAYIEKNIDFRRDHGISKDSFVVLFFGAISKYKNIEIVIHAAKYLKDKNDITFIIAGKGESSYIEELEVHGNSNNIVFINRFIEDAEITSLIQCANIVALPYDTKSSLNSGSAILSFTCDRTVICPKIGTIEDLPNQDWCWSYQYENQEEHESLFLENLQDAYALYKSNHVAFVEKGTSVGAFVRKEYSREKTAQRYKILINELL